MEAFREEFRHLQWPSLNKEIVVSDTPDRAFSTVLDIYHPLVHLRTRYVKDLPEPKKAARLYSWNDKDPLRTVLLATCGGYPSAAIGIDYSGMMKHALAAEEVCLDLNDIVPPDLLQQVCPSHVTQYLLETPEYGRPIACLPGLYVGDSQDYRDVLAYWNLRAAGIDLYFYDPAYESRLVQVKDAWLEQCRKRASTCGGTGRCEPQLSVWSGKEDSDIPPELLGQGAVRHTVDGRTWNGMHIVPVVPHFKRQSVLASLTDDEPPRAVFQLPEKPFADDPQFANEKVVVSVHPVGDVRTDSTTFVPPFVPELSEYYGRSLHYGHRDARAEPGGIGIIAGATTDTLTLRGLDVIELVQEFFRAFGIEAKTSQAGRVTWRLIQQMGGLQGCRVFKIAGVRHLIRKYSPTQSFTRSAAVQAIGNVDPETGQPDYRRYEHLFLEQAPGRRKWKPQHAFRYLLKKQVFTVGLTLQCPRCELEFWRKIDAVRSDSVCEYCGNRFRITPQLKDRDWAYRRSGLFGREDHQEGGLAVSVTLQQIDTVFMGDMHYTTGMKLSARDKDINCETDIVVLRRQRNGRTGLVIAECKTAGNIESEDITNLVKVAAALPRNRFDVYLLFAKLAPFSGEEIALCEEAQGDYRPRVIMLSERELEPYHVYELVEEEFDIRNPHVVSLEDMANATNDIYFRPTRQADCRG
ncbi:MAG: hypothetical protein R6X33_09840 [Candidatus Brocadiia bacterium]